MMKNLNRTLVHSAELAKMLSHALEVNTPDSVEEARVGRLIATMQAQATQMEEQLQRLSSEYAVEVNTTKLRLWERKLLDLSLRNNLLNMKVGKNVQPMKCADICQMEDELSQGRELLLEQSELKGIYRAMRTNLEETGANTLFIALGSLRWSERPGGRTYTAPIILLPASMVAMKKEGYAISRRDEETMLNITLIEFLNQQFGIEVEGVNPMPQDAYGIDVSLIMHQVREAIKEQPGWEVVEDAMIGIFSFTKFVMWNDIHTHASTVMDNELVRSLIEGRLMMEKTNEPADARKMDREVRPEAMAIPVDADSSQLEAVAESEREQSFILYGPPGTGKSQTITNLIANALYHNKRVLFVAQKKAALDVVHHRLQQIGLAPFCLELHSNKMDKSHFLQQMKEAIEAVGEHPEEDYKKKSEALYTQRLQLVGTLEALHAKRENGYSLYDCIERYIEINTMPLSLPKDFTKGKQLEDIHALCNQIALLDSGFALLGMTPDEHPLCGFTPKPATATGNATYMSKYAIGDTLEKVLPELPQIVENIRKQIERGKTMSFLNKTTRQYLEADYKWKKFMAIATVSNALLDDIESLTDAVNRWATHLDLLPAWKQYAEVFNQLRECGMQAAVDQYLGGVPVAEIQRAFMAAVYSQMANQIIQQDPTLNEFNGIVLDQTIDKYLALKREFQQLTRQELVARLAARIPLDTRDAALSSELTLLRKRIGNKGRGTSIRAIISQMPELLPTLCPVMLMSPLSVAQYLDMDAPKFDLVIFDEASQMPTCEAVGAMVRGKMSIVVGDPKQMPPTSFFSVNVTEEDEADIDDQESILDDCISLSMPSRYLGWHYRSKHESLIAFSNQNYYDNRLVTFPSADDLVQRVTWQHVEGYYDFGKTRTNRAEAEAIVAEAVQRMEQHPEKSLGIIAFSKQQSDLIEDLLIATMAKLPELERQNQESEEPIFIKNLENVQGDERDVILFSVGYGPDKEGRVSMNFGPLNKDGGERRLNVAISRARYEMKLFSTLLPEQIDERRTQARGVLDLKLFLKFAQQGSLTQTSDVQDNSSSIVKHIAESLRMHGYEVRTNIGTSAFQLDLAVVDPMNKNLYKLGIICDGKGYHNLKTVRDREVVQPTVLKMLGWNLMHVWTVDWYLHPEIIIKNILKTL